MDHIPVSRIWLLVALLAIGACTKEVEQIKAGQLPPNVQTFSQPKAKIWKTLVDTVRYDYLMNLEVADEKRGYFSTEMVRDYQPGQHTKFRLSGTITFDGKVNIVTLYKYLQVQDGEVWKTVPSDNALEHKILIEVAHKLSGEAKKPETKTK